MRRTSAGWGMAAVVLAASALWGASCAPNLPQPTAENKQVRPTEFRYADGVRCYYIQYYSQSGSLSCVVVR